MASTNVVAYSPPTEEEYAFYRENGYIILKNAIEPVGLNRVSEAHKRREAETKPER